MVVEVSFFTSMLSESSLESSKWYDNDCNNGDFRPIDIAAERQM